MRSPDSWGMIGVAIASVLLLLWLTKDLPTSGRCVGGYVEAANRFGYHRVEIDGKPVKCP